MIASVPRQKHLPSQPCNAVSGGLTCYRGCPIPGLSRNHCPASAGTFPGTYQYGFLPSSCRRHHCARPGSQPPPRRGHIPFNILKDKAFPVKISYAGFRLHSVRVMCTNRRTDEEKLWIAHRCSLIDSQSYRRHI